MKRFFSKSTVLLLATAMFAFVSCSKDDRVIEEMLPFYSNIYGNPSSIHLEGRRAKEALEKSREKIAKAINADAKEIYFTSGATEANNWAIRGVTKLLSKKGKHIIIQTFL